MAKYAPITAVQPGMQLTFVAANTKKPTGAAHKRYAKYPATGTPLSNTLNPKWLGTAPAFNIKGGPTVADLRYDLAHGFVKLAGTGKPSSPVAAAKASLKAAKATLPAAPASTAPASPAPAPSAAPAK
jgi:hypothetical protein